LLLTIIGIVLIFALAAALLTVTGLLMPMRIGIVVRINVERSSGGIEEATGGARLWGGLFGIGAQAKWAHVGGSSTEAIATWGLLLWRFYLPLRRLRTRGVPPDRIKPFGVSPEPRQESRVPGSRSGETPPTVQTGGASPPATSVRNSQEQFQPRGQARTIEESDRSHVSLGQERSSPSAEPSSKEAFRAEWRKWYPVARSILQKLRGVSKLCLYRVEGVIGTGDPADTAWILGAAYALAGATGGSASLRLTGDYQKRFARGRLRMEWCVSLRRLWVAGIVLARDIWKERSESQQKENAPSKP
jgi:hypothetical protein